MRTTRRELQHRWLKPIMRLSAILFVLLQAFPSFAQHDILRVAGEIKDVDTRKAMNGAVVSATDTLMPTFVRLAKVKRNGKFTVDLPLDRVYRIVFDASGHAHKHVILDTRNIPSSERKTGYGMQIKIFLPLLYPTLDYSLLDLPLGVARYEPDSKGINWQQAVSDALRERYEVFNKQYEVAKKAAGGL